MNKFLTSIVSLIVILCVVFALYTYNSIVLNPYTPYSIKCEGLVLDKNLNYHITDKNSVDALRRIRGKEITINDKDILLHYRDQDMNKITPSYWGSLYYSENEWKFKLDKSFSPNANLQENIHLPFLRDFNQPWYESLPYIGRFFRSDKKYIKPLEIVAEDDLTQNHYFNSVAGSKASRFYLQLKSIDEKLVLPWFDDGMKRSYLIKNEPDSVRVSFNPKSGNLQNHLNFVFDNSSNDRGEFDVVFNPNKKNKWSLRDIDNGSKKIIESKHFQVNNMIFSITPKYSFYQKALLSIFLLIIIFSLVFFLLNKEPFTLSPWGNNIRISILCFYLIGFPILALSLINQNFSWIREVLITIVVPLVPVATYFVSKHNTTIKDVIKNNLFGKYVLIVLLKVQNLFKKLIKNKWGVLVLLGGSIGLLFVKNQERVLGIPVLHYIKIIILLVIYIIFSDSFAIGMTRVFGSSKSSFIKLFKSLLILTFCFITSLITGDFGSLALVFFTLLIYENFNRNIPFRFFKFNIGMTQILLAYVVFSLFLLGLGYFFEMPDKAYRLTFSWLNPGNSIYSNGNEGNRQSLGILFQNLSILVENPLGIKNLSIPLASKSVSHTDFAVHWGIVNFGIPFLLILLLAFSFFCYSCFGYMYLLRKYQIVEEKTNKVVFKEGLSNVEDQIMSFTIFSLIITVLQCVAPIYSNLFLSGAFLTGIPCPGISLSVFDSLFFVVLFLLLDSITRAETNRLDEHQKYELGHNAKIESKKMTLGILLLTLVLIVIKVIMINFQSDVTKISSSEIETSKLAGLPLTTDHHKLIKQTTEYFINNNIDVTSLENADKNALKDVLVKYYKRNEKLNSRIVDFILTKENELNRICLDSLLKFKRNRISSDLWVEDPVYLEECFVNGKSRANTTSEYFSNIDFDNPYLNYDVTALTNKLVKAHVIDKLKDYKNLKVSVLVTENSTGNIVVNAGYPFNTTFPNKEFNFFAGSTKKMLLAHYFAVEHKDIEVKDEIFSSKRASTPELWIGKSDSLATLQVFNKYVDLEKFKEFLQKEHGFSYYSSFQENGYADVEADSNRKLMAMTVVGGRIKYTPSQINKWFRNVYKEVQSGNDNLKQMMQAPFFVEKGTARSVASKLQSEGIDMENLIAKTGTLDEKKINLGTAFGIGGEKYTITVLIDGKQPDNKAGKAAKHLFISLVPTLKEYIK